MFQPVRRPAEEDPNPALREIMMKLQEAGGEPAPKSSVNTPESGS